MILLSTLTVTFWSLISFTILLLCHKVVGDYDLILLHTNDVHARIQESDRFGGTCDEGEECFGGVARLKTVVDEIRDTGENVLFLNAGDNFQGTMWFYYYNGNATKTFMQELGYSAMALGNHEFDNGVQGLAPFLKDLSFPALSANIDATGDERIKSLFQPSVTLNVGGKNIGIIGYTLQETHQLVNSIGVSKLVFKDVVTAVNEEAMRLKSEGVDIIIALGHSGIEKDVDIAMEVPDVDIVIGGHSNTFLYNGQPLSIPETPLDEYPIVINQPSGRKVLVVQAYAYGKYLGYLNVTFSDNGEVEKWQGNPILLNGSIQQDVTVLSEVTELRKPIDALIGDAAGNTRVLLQGDRTVCRNEECNMGNFITDSAIDYFIKENSRGRWANISIALMNSGGIRGSISPGEFTIEDILNVNPFRNELTRIDITGETLLETLEHAVSEYNPNNSPGKLLQLSGLRVVYNVEMPQGSRVVSVEVLCNECEVPKFEPLDRTKIYPVVTNEFLVDGGDGFRMLRDKHLNLLYFGTQLTDSMLQYSSIWNPLYTKVDGRIKFVTNTEMKCESNFSEHAMPYPRLMLCIAAMLYLI